MARIIFGVKNVQFSLQQGRKVKLQHFLPRTLFGTLYVRGRERAVFFHRVGKLSYSILSPALYLARIMLGVNSVQFSLHQGREVKVQHSLLYSVRHAVC